MVVLLSRTEARWARANAASSRARRAASARGSTPVDAQTRSPHITPQSAAPMSGRNQPSLPERTWKTQPASATPQRTSPQS